MVESILLKSCVSLGKALHKSGPRILGVQIAGIVENHAIGAAIAAISSAWIPGAGATIATAACAGFVWTMYYRINDKLGIPLSRNIIKSVATAICTNLAMSAVSILAATVVSFIPGVGSIVGSLVMTMVSFSLTWTSGLIYIKVLTRLAESNPDWENVDDETLKSQANEIIEEEDIKALMKEAKSQYKAAKQRGAIEEGVECVKVEDEQPVRRMKRKTSAKRSNSASVKIKKCPVKTMRKRASSRNEGRQ